MDLTCWCRFSFHGVLINLTMIKYRADLEKNLKPSHTTAGEMLRFQSLKYEDLSSSSSMKCFDDVSHQYCSY